MKMMMVADTLIDLVNGYFMSEEIANVFLLFFFE